MKKFTCEHCNKTIVVESPHSISGHLRVCKQWQTVKRNVEKIVTKEFLCEQYIVNGRSLSHIKKQLGLKKSRFLKAKLKEFNLDHRSRSDQQIQSHTRTLTKDTCQEKYQADSPLNKGTVSRQKLDQNLLDNYGVTNVFQRKDVKSKIKKTCKRKYGTNSASSSPIVRERVRQTCLKKYGVDNVRKSPEIIQQIQDKKNKNPHCYTAASEVSQDLFSAIYKKLPLHLQQHTYFSSLNKEFGQKFDEKYFYYDFVITTVKKCIEFNGDFWHMNPKMYKTSDINISTNKTASEIWTLDKIKQDCLRSKGFNILVIWQNDYNKYPSRVIKKCLKFLGE